MPSPRWKSRADAGCVAVPRASRYAGAMQAPDSRPDHTRRGYALIALAAILWATLGPAARYSLARGIEPLEVSFWRALFGGALFAVHVLATRRGRIARRDLPAMVAFALVGVTFLFGAYFQAVRLGGASLAAVLLYTAPVWVVIASSVVLRERITRTKAGALVLTLAGVVLVATAGGANVRISAAAIGWGLASSFAYATYYLFGKRYFPRYAVTTVFMYALLLGAVGLAPLVDWSPKTAADWAVFGWLAAVPTYAAYLVYGTGLAHVEAGRAATVATLEPVVTALLAYLLWREALGARGYLGAALVLVGVLLTTRVRMRPE